MKNYTPGNVVSSEVHSFVKEGGFIRPESPPIILRDNLKHVFAGIKLDYFKIDGNILHLSGWCIGFAKLTLFCNDIELPSKIERVLRDDVANAYSISSDLTFGFLIEFENTPHGVYSLRWDLTHEGTTTPIAFKLDSSQIENKNSLIQVETQESTIRSNIESVDNFLIKGWAVFNNARLEKVSLQIADKEYRVDVVPIERKDVSSQLNISDNQLGFEVLLSGYIWEYASELEEIAIQLKTDDQIVNKNPIILTKKLLIEWIESARKSQEGDKKQFLSLLILEHLRYSKLLNRLTSQSQEYYTTFAEKMGLVDYLPLGETDRQESLPESPSTLVVWQAMRDLNNRITDSSSPQQIMESITAVLQDANLSGLARDRYLDSVIPTLCKLDIYSQLQQISYPHLWEKYEDSDHAFMLSLALPALMVAGQIQRATKLLWKLAQHLHHGWINTECIHFAVREIVRQKQTGNISFKEAEKFYYAIIGLLDAFNGKWFSRIHDQQLVKASLAMLVDWSSYPDYFRRDLTSALIRVYGLCPIFWQGLEDHYLDFHDYELKRAQQYWQKLQDIFESQNLLVDCLDDLVEPFEYFQSRNNYEVNVFLREVLINVLPQLNNKITYSGRMLLRMLLKERAEGVRIAAFPLIDKNQIQAEFPEAREYLLQTLQELSPKPKDFLFEAQVEAARLINNVNKVKDDKNVLNRHALSLATAEQSFIGVDFLAYCIASCGESRESNIPHYSELEKIVNAAIDECHVDHYLPVPIQTGLMRLFLLQGEMKDLMSLTSIFEKKLNFKFGDKYSFLFENIKPSSINMQVEGFLRDTLVAIYSCRKYVSTRISAIRETWLQNLQVRGIPYVIVVGDGDDTLEGDLLQLNVSDKYEDLPKKTLKLIDWVMNNTNFHFLYKIDDDCSLDVDRFFDSLTYRKHLYYGRVIKRDIGGMDRLWHQDKSSSEHAKHVLDKSPEPSIYADGGGGYVLSRCAMATLQKNKMTHAGQQLLLVSMMEDKLVGDLLALSSIYPNNEGYVTYQRRRTFGEAVPVGMWENTFYPAKVTPVVMTHLDTDKEQKLALAIQQTDELWPKKIWPSISAPYLEARLIPGGTIGSNQLECLSENAKLKDMYGACLHVVAVVRNEMIMLPHFLTYYRQLGVNSFIFVDNLSNDGTREYLLKQHDVVLFSADTEYKYSHYGVAWQQAVLANFCIGKWVLLVDADEMLVYPDCERIKLPEFVKNLENDGATGIRTDMIDMYPFGDLDEADFNHHSPFEVAAWFDMEPLKKWRLGSGYFSNSTYFTSALRHRLSPDSEPNAFTSQKFALFRYVPWLRFSEGLHSQSGIKLSQSVAWLAHFKYHSEFKKKVQAEIVRGQHFDNAKEYRRYAQLISETQGGFGSEEISTQYISSTSFDVDLPKI